jgi:hypothetical protein
MCLDLQVRGSGHITNPFPLTFTIEIPVEHFFKIVTFLNRGGMSYRRACNITQDTEYLDSHHWTNEARCVYKNIGYTPRNHDYNGTQPGRFNACHAERQMVLLTHKRQFAGDQLVDDVDLLRVSLVHSLQRLK